MLSNTSLRIAGAAMLGTAALLGTNAANAQITLHDDMGAVSYARETVLTTGSLDVGEGDAAVKHYLTGLATDGGREITVTSEIGIGAGASDRVLIAYTLTGMVFATDLAINAGTGDQEALQVDGEDENVRLLGGGKQKGNTALFQVTKAFNTTDTAVLSARFAISEAGSGNISMMARNVTLEGTPGVSADSTMNMESLAGAVKLVRALDESATKRTATATVDSGFQMFVAIDAATGMPASPAAEHDAGSVGTFMVGVVSPNVRLANLGSGDADALVDIALNTDNITGSSSVKFMGNFDFAGRVFLSDAPDCDADSSGTPTDLRMTETVGEETVVMDTTSAVMVDTFTTARHLCIEVAPQPTDEDAEAITIPTFGPYMAISEYENIADAAFGAMGMTHALGGIERDGATVQIPFITTFERYNQRIIVHNRTDKDVAYSITFHTMPADRADSMVAEDAMLSPGINDLRVLDLVSISGSPKRASATLVAEAKPTDISVSSLINDKESGAPAVVQHD